MGKIAYRLKGHESFIPREGWITKGLIAVNNDPAIFADNYAADKLGVGTNMAKSIRYWLRTSGLTKDVQKVGTVLTKLGELIINQDLYLEKHFTLWILHANIARNFAQATSWNVFFNDFDLNRWKRDEMLSIMEEYIVQKTGDPALSERSLRDDCSGILSMYTINENDSSDPEDGKGNVFNTLGLNKYYKYGVYTGAKSCIVSNGFENQCNKDELKRGLFSGDIKIVFCSDAASEGLNLQAARVLINVDVPWTPARLEQRIGRIARLGQVADKVVIYNVWYPNSIEARMYKRIQKRLENSNLAIGEFPDVVAKKIRTAVMNGEDNDNTGLNELLDIRNSKQLAALDELWSQTGSSTESELMRERLIAICSKFCKLVDTELDGIIKVFEAPDGKKYKLTYKSGMPESISLKSRIWDYVKYYNPVVTVINDLKQRPAYFAINKDGVTIELKHSSILKIILKEKLDGDDVLITYPPMLPNSKHLDLSYSIECELKPVPAYWVE